jgi:hypothetical protein
LAEHFADPVAERLNLALNAEKVGPHGYEHGWIFVGVPGAEHAAGDAEHEAEAVKPQKASDAFPNLPGDIKDAMSRYEDDVASGRIQFGARGEATSYPGKEQTETGLMQHVASHTHFGAVSQGESGERRNDLLGTYTPGQTKQGHLRFADCLPERQTRAQQWHQQSGGQDGSPGTGFSLRGTSGAAQPAAQEVSEPARAQ